jgi:hypothetical protein
MSARINWKEEFIFLYIDEVNQEVLSNTSFKSFLVSKIPKNLKKRKFWIFFF